MIVNWSQNWRLRSLALEWVLEHRVGTRKKRRGKGKEPIWKAKYYYGDPCNALAFLVAKAIRRIKGEYPASVFEPFLEGMIRIEGQIREVKDQFKGLLEVVPSGAKVPLGKNRSHHTPANENAVAQKRAGKK